MKQIEETADLVQVAKTKEGNKRVTGKEQFYTPTWLAEKLVVDVLNVMSDKEKETLYWYEPAGGTGNFVKAALKQGLVVSSSDIEPKHELIRKVDFLKFHDFAKLRQHWVVYGNPPFGRNNSLSIKFFNHAASFERVEYIAFLVPRSWRKWSVMDRLNPLFECIYDIDLVDNFVDESGVEFTGSSLKTCFQIWKRSTSLRKPVEVEDRGYITKCEPDVADVSLTVFGYGCGKVKTEFERVSNSTQMFLQCEPEIVDALKEIDLSEFFDRTAYIPALSIREIRYCLNRYFDTLNGKM